MSKSIISILSLVSICGIFPLNAYSARNLEQESLEKAKGKSTKPWEVKTMPPDTIAIPHAQTPKAIKSKVTNPKSTDIKTMTFKSANWKGYLIGVDSANRSYPNLDWLRNYDRDKALSPDNRTKGYLLYAIDGKHFSLDKHGNELAIKAIESSLKDKGFYVAVNGKLKGNIISVDNLVEVMDAPTSSDGRHEVVKVVDEMPTIKR